MGPVSTGLGEVLMYVVDFKPCGHEAATRESRAGRASRPTAPT